MASRARVKIAFLSALVLVIGVTMTVKYKQVLVEELVPKIRKTATFLKHCTETAQERDDGFNVRHLHEADKTQVKKNYSSVESRVKMSGGYVLAYDYWEQLTSASRNLQYLQCWAGKINMSVVEPFIKKSSFSSDYASLKFSDLYDIDYWTNLSSNNTLASWKEFFKRAPRNLITVNIKYGATGQVAVQSESLYRQGCEENKAMRFLEQHNFKTVRKVCINFSHNKVFTLEEFNREVFGQYQPSLSTVLFSQWRGLGDQRVQICNSGCKQVTAHFKMSPSQRLLRDADKYATSYLRTSSYIAIMARMEKARHIEKNVAICFQQTLEKWDKVVNDTGIKSTFLSADMGKYGSHSLQHNADNLNDEFQQFFAKIYGNRPTVRQWESTFEHVSGTSNQGYISVLQKVLAARAKCLVLVGGGSYQEHAMQLYLKEHLAPDNQCIYIVQRCTGTIHQDLIPDIIYY